ncbi:MAG: amino acid permease, partial [Acidobacteria bacterium]|nr:amino acid permease [Acidobacteriota bacterium]
LLQAMWTYTGYDASASVSEETIDPRRRAPWGMVMAVVVSSVVGYLLLIALTLAIKDIPSVLTADVPPVVAILIGALGERAGSLFSALVAMAMWFCGLSAVTWSSRVIWAFARDEGLPLAHVWKHVDRKHLTPAPAIWLCVAAALGALVYSKAYAVVTAISTIGLYVSYILPVWLHWRTGVKPERGPWHLGKYSATINLIAIAWVIFLCVVLCLADARTWQSMLAVTLALALWYALRERHRFKGPSWSNQ